MARSSTSFQPGTSGNPGGRPKGLSEVIALAREHTELAITTLVDIARQPKAAPAARVAAASALLDRGWGKPAQAIQATTTNGIVTLISGRWRRSHLVDAPHHATHQAHVSCRQTLNASDRIAR